MDSDSGPPAKSQSASGSQVSSRRSSSSHGARPHPPAHGGKTPAGAKQMSHTCGTQATSPPPALTGKGTGTFPWTSPPSSSILLSPRPAPTGATTLATFSPAVSPLESGLPSAHAFLRAVEGTPQLTTLRAAPREQHAPVASWSASYVAPQQRSPLAKREGSGFHPSGGTAGGMGPRNGGSATRRRSTHVLLLENEDTSQTPASSSSGALLQPAAVTATAEETPRPATLREHDSTGSPPKDDQTVSGSSNVFNMGFSATVLEDSFVDLHSAGRPPARRTSVNRMKLNVAKAVQRVTAARATDSPEDGGKDRQRLDERGGEDEERLATPPVASEPLTPSVPTTGSSLLCKESRFMSSAKLKAACAGSAPPPDSVAAPAHGETVSSPSFPVQEGARRAITNASAGSPRRGMAPPPTEGERAASPVAPGRPRELGTRGPLESHDGSRRPSCGSVSAVSPLSSPLPRSHPSRRASETKRVSIVVPAPPVMDTLRTRISTTIASSSSCSASGEAAGGARRSRIPSQSAGSADANLIGGALDAARSQGNSCTAKHRNFSDSLLVGMHEFLTAVGKEVEAAALNRAMLEGMYHHFTSFDGGTTAGASSRSESTDSSTSSNGTHNDDEEAEDNDESDDSDSALCDSAANNRTVLYEEADRPRRTSARADFDLVSDASPADSLQQQTRTLGGTLGPTDAPVAAPRALEGRQRAEGRRKRRATEKKALLPLHELFHNLRLTADWFVDPQGGGQLPLSEEESTTGTDEDADREVGAGAGAARTSNGPAEPPPYSLEAVTAEPPLFFSGMVVDPVSERFLLGGMAFFEEARILKVPSGQAPCVAGSQRGSSAVVGPTEGSRLPLRCGTTPCSAAAAAAAPGASFTHKILVREYISVSKRNEGHMIQTFSLLTEEAAATVMPSKQQTIASELARQLALQTQPGCVVRAFPVFLVARRTKRPPVAPLSAVTAPPAATDRRLSSKAARSSVARPPAPHARSASATPLAEQEIGTVFVPHLLHVVLTNSGSSSESGGSRTNDTLRSEKLADRPLVNVTTASASPRAALSGAEGGVARPPSPPFPAALPPAARRRRSQRQQHDTGDWGEAALSFHNWNTLTLSRGAAGDDEKKRPSVVHVPFRHSEVGYPMSLGPHRLGKGSPIVSGLVTRGDGGGRRRHSSVASKRSLRSNATLKSLWSGTALASDSVGTDLLHGRGSTRSLGTNRRPRREPIGHEIVLSDTNPQLYEWALSKDPATLLEPTDNIRAYLAYFASGFTIKRMVNELLAAVRCVQRFVRRCLARKHRALESMVRRWRSLEVESRLRLQHYRPPPSSLERVELVATNVLQQYMLTSREQKMKLIQELWAERKRAYRQYQEQRRLDAYVRRCIEGGRPATSDGWRAEQLRVAQESFTDNSPRRSTSSTADGWVQKRLLSTTAPGLEARGGRGFGADHYVGPDASRRPTNAMHEALGPHRLGQQRLRASVATNITASIDNSTAEPPRGRAELDGAGAASIDSAPGLGLAQGASLHSVNSHSDDIGTPLVGWSVRLLNLEPRRSIGSDRTSGTHDPFHVGVVNMKGPHGGAAEPQSLAERHKTAVFDALAVAQKSRESSEVHARFGWYIPPEELLRESHQRLLASLKSSVLTIEQVQHEVKRAATEATQAELQMAAEMVQRGLATNRDRHSGGTSRAGKSSGGAPHGSGEGRRPSKDTRTSYQLSRSRDRVDNERELPSQSERSSQSSTTRFEGSRRLPGINDTDQLNLPGRYPSLPIIVGDVDTSSTTPNNDRRFAALSGRGLAGTVPPAVANELSVSPPLSVGSRGAGNGHETVAMLTLPEIVKAGAKRRTQRHAAADATSASSAVKAPRARW